MESQCPYDLDDHPCSCVSCNGCSVLEEFEEKEMRI